MDERSQRNPELRQAPKPWKCDRCSSTFQRLDHFQRHESTHDTTQHHACLFCGSAFGRRDVLRRHWKSCKARVDSGHGIPAPGRGGKHKRACDNCAVLRKACTGQLPCSTCIQRDKECSYQRLVGDVSSSAQVPIESANAECSTLDSEPTWDLGISTLYPSMRATGR